MLTRATVLKRCRAKSLHDVRKINLWGSELTDVRTQFLLIFPNSLCSR